MRYNIVIAMAVILVGCTTKPGVDSQALVDKAVQAERLGKHEEAIAIYESLAKQSDTRSMITLGMKYHKGDGVTQDYKKAMDWYLKAYAKRDGDAFNNIGVMYREGHGVEKNEQIAYLLFLAIHMTGLGTEATQYRAGGNLSRISQDIGDESMKEALCWTWAYVDQYVKSHGTQTEVSAEVLPSEKRPRIKDNNWWLPNEQENLKYECKPPWN